MRGVEIDEGVATVTVDNPPLNLLSMAVRAEFAEQLTALGNDAGCRAVVVTGAGERAFSAGSDITEFPRGEAEGRARSRREHELFEPLAALPQPTVAALHGHVLGGGLELALCCDLRVADAGTVLGFPEVTLGLAPCGGGTSRLPHLVGAAAAKRLLLTGDRVDASEAARIGLVDEVVPEGESKAAARRLAERIAARPARTVVEIKAIVEESTTAGVRAGLAAEERVAGRQFASTAARQAVEAFLTGKTSRSC